MIVYSISGRYLTVNYQTKHGTVSSTVAYAKGSDPRPLARMAYASAKQEAESLKKHDRD